MGFFDKVFGKPKLSVRESIPVEAKKAADLLNERGYNADFTIKSFMEVDRFFDDETKPKGLLSGNVQDIIFSLGCYVGETIIKKYGGKWVVFDNDRDHSYIRVTDEITIKPVIRCLKRYGVGESESIYEFGLSVKSSKKDLRV